jgi:hypothetical protein
MCGRYSQAVSPVLNSARVDAPELIKRVSVGLRQNGDVDEK